MKCIKYKDGSISRLANDKAIEAVSSGKAKYIPKAEWKPTRKK